MKIKTSELTGAALDWAVAKCEGKNVDPPLPGFFRWLKDHRYSTDWSQGGPIIEREGIDVLKDGAHWTALKTATILHGHLRLSGPTPLVAAMRCRVASKLGDEVDVPEELLDPPSH